MLMLLLALVPTLAGAFTCRAPTAARRRLAASKDELSVFDSSVAKILPLVTEESSGKLNRFEHIDERPNGLMTTWAGAVGSDAEVMFVHHLRDYGVHLINFDDCAGRSAEDLARFVSAETGLPAIAEHTTLSVDGWRGGIGRDAEAYRIERLDAKAEKLLARLKAVSPQDRRLTYTTTVAYDDGTSQETSQAEATVDISCATIATSLVCRAEALHRLTARLPLTFQYYEARLEQYYSGDPSREKEAARALRTRIRDEARVLPNGDVDVSSFVGRCVDVRLLDECAKELVEAVRDDAITKVLTTGASGQQIAMPIARLLNVQLICAKREQPGMHSSPLGRTAYADCIDVTYQSKHYGPGQQLFVHRDAFDPDDRVLVVDDFLASGSCQEAMLRLTVRAKAQPVALAVLVEKSYERARDFLAGYEIPIVSLATITSVDNGYIYLANDDSPASTPPPEEDEIPDTQ